MMHDNQTKCSTKLDTTCTEASKMLEAALNQMDDIISGANVNSSGTNASPQMSILAETEVDDADEEQPHRMEIYDSKPTSASKVLSLAKALASALHEVGGTVSPPDVQTAAIIKNWLENDIFSKDIDQSTQRRPRDRESIELSYQELVNRTSQQADRIIELESLLTEKTQQLSVKDEQLQRQVLSLSTIETQKLELITALSELKLHRAKLVHGGIELAKGTSNESCIIDNSEAGSQVIKNCASFDKNIDSLGNVNYNQSSKHQIGVPKTPPSSQRNEICQFHSLPRLPKNYANNNNHDHNNVNNRSFDANANTPMTKQRNVAFASKDNVLIEDNSCSKGDVKHFMRGTFMSPGVSSLSPYLRERSSKGFRNIFGKLRRSNSGNLELPVEEEVEHKFKRGVIERATTGGRIEWIAQSLQCITYSKNYQDWLPNEVCSWLCDLGLGCYEEDCRNWLKENSKVCFFTASPTDIEKELNLKSPLHRKKILLAVDEVTGKENDSLTIKAGQLDTSWTLRWLDDIGLPQYKDTFTQAKMDGRMLHRLTMEDLACMNITSCLHIASLRCGIQIMRKMNWDPECLIRRSTTAFSRDVGTDFDEMQKNDSVNSSQCIALWTAHRVMEWLRVADLSEYAPNLRGAGVHGAFMIFETRFNADLLGDLLSIPSSKTLLRRHLATHFKELLGRDILQIKRNAEAATGYQPLTISAKLKPLKKTQFSLKRRKSNKGFSDIEWTDYVCPMTFDDPLCVLTAVSPKQSCALNATFSASLSSTSANESSALN